MKGKTHSLSRAYALLLLGAGIVMGLLYASTNLGTLVGPFHRAVLLHLWILSPFALLAFNTWAVSRFIMGGGGEKMFIGGAALFALSGLIIYGRVFLVPDPRSMSANIVFLFGPLHHFVVAVLTTIVYFVRSFFQLLPGGRGEKERSDPQTSQEEPRVTGQG